MTSFIQPLVDSSINSYDRIASTGPDRVARLQAIEEQAADFAVTEQIHKSNVAMDAKVRSNTKELLVNIGLRLSAQV